MANKKDAKPDLPPDILFKLMVPFWNQNELKWVYLDVQFTKLCLALL